MVMPASPPAGDIDSDAVGLQWQGQYQLQSLTSAAPLDMTMCWSISLLYPFGQYIATLSFEFLGLLWFIALMMQLN